LVAAYKGPRLVEAEGFPLELAHQPQPTDHVHSHRNMADMSVCSIYSEQESWRHSQINCMVAQCVWTLAKEGMVII
jgi:hypothetical protein